jgi:hypothetical protein
LHQQITAVSQNGHGVGQPRALRLRNRSLEGVAPKRGEPECLSGRVAGEHEANRAVAEATVAIVEEQLR